MNVSKSAFYKNLVVLRLGGPNFCGTQVKHASLQALSELVTEIRDQRQPRGLSASPTCSFTTPQSPHRWYCSLTNARFTAQNEVLATYTGMFWSAKCANLILALLSSHLNGRFEDYWESHRAT